MKRFNYTFDGHKIRVELEEGIWLETNSDGEGLFLVNVARNTRSQLEGTCQFSVRGLSKDAARKKMRKAIPWQYAEELN